MLLNALQAHWRKVQSLGLAQCYMLSDPTLKHFVKKMAAINFCQLPFVTTTWLAVQLEALQIPYVDELVPYFDSTWMNRQFKCHQWNYFNFKRPCTNNHVEGWHSCWKKVNHIPTSMRSMMSSRGRSKHKDETADAGSWRHCVKKIAAISFCPLPFVMTKPKQKRLFHKNKKRNHHRSVGRKSSEWYIDQQFKLMSSGIDNI